MNHGHRGGRAFNRRTFLFGATATGLTVARCPTSLALAQTTFSDYPFTLGVASGEPLPDGVVLWTRLAPEPFAVDGGMPPAPVEVRWQVAEDEGMTKVVQQGTAIAEPGWAHSVHVEAQGLEPDRWYWHQFMAGSEISPIGRTRTAPAAGARVDQLRVAFASCQRWDDGFYLAHRDIAARELDLVLFLGDYIYEEGISDTGGVRGVTLPMDVRLEPRTLDQYRLRYAVYKSDPDLQAAHAAFPWIVSWDDHEVENDYAADLPNPMYDKDEFLLRRTAAYKAFYEHQPLRSASIPRGPDLRLYRRLTFGDLVAINLLDTRQYRSHQHLSCSADEHLHNGGYCAASLDPGRTMLGAEQKRWLLDGLATTASRWNVLAQQVPMAQNDQQSGPGVIFGGKIGDKWDGYAHERDELLLAIAEMSKQQQRPLNPIALAGDVHDNYVSNLKTDWNSFGDESTVGAEFVGTSVTSEGDSEPRRDGAFHTRCQPTLDNPHQLFFDNHRGYVTCAITPDRWHTEFRVLPSVEVREATATTLASFVVENGRPGALLDQGCGSEEMA